MKCADNAITVAAFTTATVSAAAAAAAVTVKSSTQKFQKISETKPLPIGRCVRRGLREAINSSLMNQTYHEGWPFTMRRCLPNWTGAGMRYLR